MKTTDFDVKTVDWGEFTIDGWSMDDEAGYEISYVYERTKNIKGHIDSTSQLK